MIPWLLLDTATIPGASGGTLRLKRRGGEFSIMLGDNELMNSRRFGSEEQLAALACDRIKSSNKPRVLIGGLGMGFTLRAALGALPHDAEIVVAELVPAVIAWASGPMAEVFGQSLDDPRVALVEDDVRRVMQSGARYDAIILDVDNGPEGLTRQSNDVLYSLDGLQAAHARLNPGGVLAVWSQGSDAAFTARLRRAGFAVEEIQTRANTKRGSRHLIWIATRPG